MLLKDILRDTEARIASLQPTVDEFVELKAAADALRKVGIKPSATMTVIDLDADRDTDGVLVVEDGQGRRAAMETLEATKYNSQASVPSEPPEKHFNTRYKRGIVSQIDSDKYNRFTFKRKDDESTYTYQSPVSKKTALNWLNKAPAHRLKEGKKA